jgi:hypothetical protein
LIEIDQIEFSGNRNCYECRLGGARLIITADFGPRIISLTAGGGPNALFVDETGQKGRGDWRLYGGHRLWIAPETAGTYAPDNEPCRVKKDAGGITVTAPPTADGLEKSITVCERAGNFLITHTVVNRSDTLSVGAIWALTCVRAKSTAFFPWGTGGDWDLKKIVYWKKWMDHTTDPGGAQFVSTDDLFLVAPDGSEGKVGTSGHGGFIGATEEGFTLIKRFDRRPDAPYPDEECAVQCYTCADFVELETLGPLVTFFPNTPVVHEEVWVVRDRAVDPTDGAAVRSLA